MWEEIREGESEVIGEKKKERGEGANHGGKLRER